MVRIIVSDYYITLIGTSTEMLCLVDSIATLTTHRKANTYTCSLKELPQVLFLLRGITEASQISNDFVRQMYEKEIIRRIATTELLMHGPVDTHQFLWPHQQLGVELARINNRYAFFYDTRTGKTLMSYQIMLEALTVGNAKRCLVICPSTIIDSWLSDAKMFPALKILVYSGSQANRQNTLSSPAHIIVWSMELAVNSIELLKSIKFDVCFVDESSKLKSYKAQISKAMLELSTTIPRWYLLSATPAPNGEHEYYIQMRTVDYCMFPAARKHFVEKYFNDMAYNAKFEKLKIKPELYLEFMSIVKERAVYVDQSIMPTAGKEWHEHEFELPDNLRDMYDDMKNNMYATVSQNFDIVVDMATSMRAKLTQLASGFIMDTSAIKDNITSKKLQKVLGIVNDEEQEVFILDYARVEALQNLLATFGEESVVIWANYHAEFEMILECLGSKAKIINGGTSLTYKMETIRAFRAKEFQYLVCHPLSVGMGINLTVAHLAVYYSLNDSWEALKQSSERIAGHINVQPKKCEYYVLQAKNTYDSHIYTNVKNKRDLSTDFLAYLKSGG